MNVHYINTPSSSMWLDLDHVIAVSNLVSPSGLGIHSSFYVTVAFLNEPLVFRLYDKAHEHITGHWASTFTYTPPDEQHIEQFNQAYDALMEKWSKQRSAPIPVISSDQRITPTKKIIVDVRGLPATGKTFICRLIAEALRQHGIQTKLFYGPDGDPTRTREHQQAGIEVLRSTLEVEVREGTSTRLPGNNV
jgi:6-phosphofructo-2-kinase